MSLCKRKAEMGLINLQVLLPLRPGLILTMIDVSSERTQHNVELESVHFGNHRTKMQVLYFSLCIKISAQNFQLESALVLILNQGHFKNYNNSDILQWETQISVQSANIFMYTGSPDLKLRIYYLSDAHQKKWWHIQKVELIPSIFFIMKDWYQKCIHIYLKYQVWYFTKSEIS